MITTQELSKRIFQFFDAIYSSNKASFGFSNDSNDAFLEQDWNQSIRPSTTPETQGFFTTGTGAMFSNMTLFNGVTNGKFSLSKDGATAVPITGVNWSASLTYAAGATVLANRVAAAGISGVAVAYNATAQKYVFTSETIGQDSSIVITSATGTGTDLTGANYFNGGIATQGTNRNVTTILFYKIDTATLGNGINSATIRYDTANNEIVENIRDIEVTIDILSKKYQAKDAMYFLDSAVQSDRKNIACYGSSFLFDLILYNVTNEINLTELEKGAWTERMQKKLYFKYVDTVLTNEVLPLQTPLYIDQVKDIYQYEIITKE